MKTTKIVEAVNALSGLGGALARAVVALLEAEVDRLRFDLRENWGRLFRLALLAGLAFGVIFWALGAVLFAAGALLATVLPVWAAALVLAGALLLSGYVLLLVARSRARRLESPVDTVRRRVGNHVAFWQELVADAPAPAAEAGDGRQDGAASGDRP